MTKNRRLTKASVYRYLQKRLQLSISQQLKVGLGKVQEGNPEAFKIALQTAYEETVNWATDQAIYHEVRAVVKTVAESYGLPTRLQGLLMAYGEKVLANFFIDDKGSSLPDIEWEYARKLLNYTAPTGNNLPTGYIKANGKPVAVTTILNKIAVEVAKLVSVSGTAVGGYLAPSHLHVT